MSRSLEDVRNHLRLNNLREAAYMLFSIARSETDDYHQFDEVAEIELYYSLRRASKYHPERINLLFQYLHNIEKVYAVLANINIFLATGVNKGLKVKQTPYEMLYFSARA